MYKNILVPMALDHDVSPEALKVARTLLSDDGKITALHVYEMPNGSVAAYLDEETVRNGFNKAKSRMNAKLAGFEDVTPVMKKGHTARTIVDYASSENIDCIVIGSHKPGLGDFLLGSTAARVVRHSNCAVHVLR